MVEPKVLATLAHGYEDSTAITQAALGPPDLFCHDIVDAPSTVDLLVLDPSLFPVVAEVGVCYSAARGTCLNAEPVEIGEMAAKEFAEVSVT